MRRDLDNLHRPTGFTLTELIVVVSLMSILMGTLIPGVTAMRKKNQVKAAMNSISAAVIAARVYATQDKMDLQDIGDPTFAGFTYSGAAALFTPAGEIRLVANDQNAVNGASNYLEPDRNGYQDVDGRDYIKLPRDAGVVGIGRGTGLYLFTPPFAIYFNGHGNQIAAMPTGVSDHRVVYYDGDYDDPPVYETSNGRPTSGYNPDTSDPSMTTVAKPQGKYVLPFEEIETVIGVVVYSKNDLRDAGHTHIGSGTSGSLNAAARDWILANGESMLFSRYSGTRAKP